MHIIFQTLERWAGISSKGGPTNQTQCDFGFISLLEHLVSLSAWKERGKKYVKALTTLSPDAFSLSAIVVMKPTASNKTDEAYSVTARFAKTHFYFLGHESSVQPSFFEIPV